MAVGSHRQQFWWGGHRSVWGQQPPGTGSGGWGSKNPTLTFAIRKGNHGEERKGVGGSRDGGWGWQSLQVAGRGFWEKVKVNQERKEQNLPGRGVRSALRTPQPEHPRTPIVMLPLSPELGSPGRQWDGEGEGRCFCPQPGCLCPTPPRPGPVGSPQGWSPRLDPIAGPHSVSPCPVPVLSPMSMNYPHAWCHGRCPMPATHGWSPHLVAVPGPYHWSPWLWCPYQVPKAVQGAWSLRLVLPPSLHTQMP